MQMANLLSTAQALTGDWHSLFNQLDKINAVTPDDIKRIANKTFSFDNRTIATIDPIEKSSSK
jgi:predicted Zn-dependent peptidase